MSNKVWERRRLRQRLLRACRVLQRDPQATVAIMPGIVAISDERHEQLRAAFRFAERL